MRPAVITALTGPAAVEVRDVAEPATTDGRILIDLEFAGVGFPDVLHTRGGYQLRPDLPLIPGWEASGSVRSDVHGFQAGDRVAALSVLGGLAESVAVEANQVFPLSDGLPYDIAAAVPLNYLTARLALLRRARPRSGEVVLVHGAAGGLGSAACAIAATHGARVIGVVSSSWKATFVRQAGVCRTSPRRSTTRKPSSR